MVPHRILKGRNAALSKIDDWRYKKFKNRYVSQEANDSPFCIRDRNNGLPRGSGKKSPSVVWPEKVAMRG